MGGLTGFKLFYGADCVSTVAAKKKKKKKSQKTFVCERERNSRAGREVGGRWQVSTQNENRQKKKNKKAKGAAENKLQLGFG